MRIIAHVDMDAFFAACEERYNPQFRGKPLVVGADPKGGRGRGVVSTANYEARKFGIRSALPISKAWQFAEAASAKGAEETIFVEGNYQLYAEVSERIMAILERASDKFEQASVDEAYLDISSAGSYDDAKAKARAIKIEIKKQEGLSASIGVAPNKLIAKIASDHEKPDGLTVVPPESVIDFLKPMSIRAIPGIGPKAEIVLNKQRIKTVADLQRLTEEELINELGKWGSNLYQKARGISEDEVSNEWEAKSIGAEETFEEDTLSAARILERVRYLVSKVHRHFREDGASSFRRVAIRIRFADFQTLTRAKTLSRPANDEKTIETETLKLLLPFFDQRQNPKQKKIRLIGVRVEELGRTDM